MPQCGFVPDVDVQIMSAAVSSLGERLRFGRWLNKKQLLATVEH